MVTRPEFGRPAERRNKVPRDHAVRRLILTCGPSCVREGDPGLFDHHPGDRPPRDLCHGPLKEVQEEDIPQRILYQLEVHPYVPGDALHKFPLLLEGLLATVSLGG